MKRIISLLVCFLFSNSVYAALTDIKFGQYQIADSQWNVSACLYTTTCQIYSKNPGTAYKIPWTSGQVQWGAGDYVKLEASGDPNYPYVAKQYTSNGTLKSILGTGKIVNMGPDYFFFVGNDNNTGQLFSGSSGMSDTSGVSWTGTLNPTTAQADTYADANYSTVPLASGETATSTPSSGSTPPSDPNTTVVGTSSGMTAAQTTTKNIAQTRRDSYWGNNIYVDQIGDSNNITIKQESANNTIRGYANQTAQFHGSNNTVDIRQGAQGVPGKNLVELDYNGGLNNIKIYQDRYDDGSQDDNAYGNHVARASVNGNSNTLSIIQRNNLSYPQGNYADVTITGSSNNVSTLQISDVGKNAFVNIQGDSNVVNLTQRENSAHYADIKLQGNGHNVTLEQKGVGAHRANIDLVNNGASSTVNVLQQGTTQQSYSLQQTCVALPCGASIIQGQ